MTSAATRPLSRGWGRLCTRPGPVLIGSQRHSCPLLVWPLGGVPGLKRTMARRQPSSVLSICMSRILDTSSVNTLQRRQIPRSELDTSCQRPHPGTPEGLREAWCGQGQLHGASWWAVAQTGPKGRSLNTGIPTPGTALPEMHPLPRQLVEFHTGNLGTKRGLLTSESR